MTIMLINLLHLNMGKLNVLQDLTFNLITSYVPLVRSYCTKTELELFLVLLILLE